MPVDFSNPANRKRKPRYNAARTRDKATEEREKQSAYRQKTAANETRFDQWQKQQLREQGRTYYTGYTPRQTEPLPARWTGGRANRPTYYEGSNEAQRAQARMPAYNAALKKARYYYNYPNEAEIAKGKKGKTRNPPGSLDYPSEAEIAAARMFRFPEVLPMPPAQPYNPYNGYNSGYGGHGYGGGGYGGGGGGGYSSYPEYTGAGTRQPNYTRATYAPNIPRWMTALVNWRLGE